MSFCKFLTNTYHFTYDVVKPCCWIQDTKVSILDHDKIKTEFSRLNQINDWTPECNYCYKLEAAGTQSPRTIAEIEPIFVKEHEVGETIKLELQLDEDCNAACIMCSDFNSTTWKKYNENTVKSKKIKIHHKTTVEERIAAVLATVNFDTVRQIHFFGGEPFNTDTQLRIIKLIKHPEHTNLVYVTNGSTFPCEETRELWKRFKHVNVAVSIDGIGEHFNYLRWPLQWHQVEDNLRTYRDMIDVNFDVNSSFTGSSLNLYYIDRYTAWATEFFKDVKLNKLRYFNWFKNPHPVVGTMNLECVPTDLKVAIGDKYGTDSRIYKIIDQFNEIKYQKFIEHLEFHDQHRKLNFRTTFPEVAKYWK
jgi:hypothetical protein